MIVTETAATTTPAVETKTESSILDSATTTQTAPAASTDQSILDSAGAKPEGDKPAADAPKESEKTKTEEKPKTGAPEKYDEFKLPEGMTFTGQLKEEFSAVAKELNLTQEQAQKLVDLQAAQTKAQTDAAMSSFEKIKSDWKAEALKEFGPNAQEKLTAIAKARTRFVGKELNQLLNDTGLASHKEVLKLLHTIGNAISEDTPVDGETNGGKSAADLLFPTMNKGN